MFVDFVNRYVAENKQTNKRDIELYKWMKRSITVQFTWLNWLDADEEEDQEEGEEKEWEGSQWLAVNAQSAS